jgi:ABC-type multidrug transport system fused ATPase/permease subunit
LERGIVRESGTHDALLALPYGLYKNLHRLQMDLD